MASRRILPQRQWAVADRVGVAAAAARTALPIHYPQPGGLQARDMTAIQPMLINGDGRDGDGQGAASRIEAKSSQATVQRAA